MDGRKCWEYVTPFAGVWIEILANGSQNKEKGVTPFAGVWIEILPSGYTTLAQNVTPFAGVWIEIVVLTPVPMHVYRHSLRGSVD